MMNKIKIATIPSLLVLMLILVPAPADSAQCETIIGQEGVIVQSYDSYYVPYTMVARLYTSWSGDFVILYPDHRTIKLCPESIDQIKRATRDWILGRDRK